MSQGAGTVDVLTAREDQIGPAFWAGALVISFTAHLLILETGLLNVPGEDTEPPSPLEETDIVIESGGLIFEAVDNIDVVTAETAAPDAVPVISAPLDAAQNTQAVPIETVPDTGIQAERVAPETAEIADSTSDFQPVPLSEAPVAGQTAITAVTPVGQPDAAIAQPAPASNGIAQDLRPLEPLKPATGPAAGSPDVTPVQPFSADAQTTITAVRPVDGQPSTDQLVVIPSPQDSVAAEGAGTERPSGGVVGTNQPTALSPVVSSSAGVSVLRPAPVVVGVPDASTPVAAAAVDDPSKTPGEPIRPSNTAAVGATAPVIEGVGVPAGTATVIEPAGEQVAALPSAASTPSIPPSPSGGTSVQPAALPNDTPDAVTPSGVAGLDLMESAAAYVAAYQIGDCAHLSVTEVAADRASVTGFGAAIDPFISFDQHFKADNGFEAQIELRIVSRPQCVLLDTLGLTQGVEAPGLVTLDRSVVASGAMVRGIVERDLPLSRIAAAEAEGLVLNGNGPPELYLIDGAGQVHDGRAFLLPASNRVTAGGWKFQVPVTLMSAGDEETALILAIWNRTAERQPGSFGTVSSARIPDILRHPGVYSLTAFKVVR
ncbi:hypothetical protein E1180_21200 [Roseibium denhamense]|uniref:Uncharacterized protein n=1 Tax=Roseibium denhamense TaxID=76305 RepID=A0ABY1NQR7_9HYPH|nr:hypothetical protein [Roseibium denhamense]MTI08021.1 hypothetical protein [Roseibium denhamense]SMP15598.1 hypothetical protein SAMN06265374_1609 [Roseibium denhamense]